MHHTRLHRLALGLLAVVLAPAAFGATAAKPNILLICVDDLRPELGCYGASYIKSPNIDRLAKESVTFDRCYVQVAVCNPSRASFLSGLRPNTLNCWSLPYHFRETRPDTVTLPQYLRANGYTAEGYGKIYHNPWQDPQSWSREHQWGDGDWYNYSPEQKKLIAEVRKTLPADDWRKTSLRGPITNAPDIADEQHPDGSMTRMVIDRLKALKDSDKPFFLAAGYILPHAPWCPPKKYWDMYDRAKLPLATNTSIPKNAPAVALGTNYEMRHYADNVNFPAPLDGSPDEATARRIRHGYFAGITFVDTQIGRLLDALKAEGLADNTIVVFWSDHGYKLGEHNAWGKMTDFEIDTRIPFIVHDPRAKANGRRVPGLVETLDIFPTVCELAGVPVPAYLEGKSFAPLLNAPETPHLDAAYSQYIYAPLIGDSVRTTAWRYVEWRDMKDGAVKFRELYDHRASDEENDNVVDANPGVAAQMRTLLDKKLPPHPVSELPAIHSPAGGEKLAVKFVNRHAGTVRVSWIDARGRRALEFDVPAGKSHALNSRVGHIFVAEALDGSYVERFTLGADTATVTLDAKVAPAASR